MEVVFDLEKEVERMKLMFIILFILFTKTSHTQNGICTLKIQYFS